MNAQRARANMPRNRHQRLAWSKEMSRLLRHAPPAGAMDAQGWIPLDVLARHIRGHPTHEDIRQIVADDSKQRFVLDEHSTPPRIRAAQGHSIALPDPQLTPVTNAAAVPLAVHATSPDSWNTIKACGELRRMNRTHIHFATELHLLRSNSWANVFLLLKLQEALAAGHCFFLSANGVLLCEGPLPVGFVEVVPEAELTAHFNLPQG